MRKRTLRSVLVAAFSAVVAFGALSGLSGAKSDAWADSSWGSVRASAGIVPDSSWGPTSPMTADDSSWG
ncbi:hypothetical protein DN051_18995 [Streptomyces cadmiisoli]|uniref:5'-nucleotidase n=1 Tax=Streptomyces cadmiisoli TaxID=2184053 RepID=A0A2Z4J0U1_9ACTN|nr:hypothetical protein [Streptomyces cadmiisoli]AWW38486.1 hypothetical protein DN051_18995 [Streptomyces cadmiisoli]